MTDHHPLVSPDGRDEGSGSRQDEAVNILTLQVHGRVLEIAESFPPIPASVVELAAVILAVAEDQGEIEDVAAVLRQDVALATMILSEANSAASAPVKEIVTIEAAITRLGLARLLAVSCAATIGSRARAALAAYQLPDGALWDHSVTASYVAEAIYHSVGGKVGPDVVTSALLHDIGQVVLDKVLDPKLFARATASLSVAAAERELLDVTHAEAGALLLEMWGIPAVITQTVANHHDPRYSDTDPATVVSLASDIAHKIHENVIDPQPPEEPESQKAAEVLAVDLHTILHRSLVLLQAAGRRDAS